jgi:dynein intermediate chain 3, axonemal
LYSSQDQQKELGLEIGPNISAEQPWKQLRKELLQDYLPNTAELTELKENIRIMEDEQFVLIGYAPTLSETEDLFIIFNNERVAKEASEIIQKLEAFERQRAKNVTFKTPRKWKSYGSEREVDMFIVKPKSDLVDVEIQSIYPIKHSRKAEFSFRRVDDVRDGYVELLPDRTVFDNIARKQIDAGVQSAPPKVGMEQQTDPTFPTNAWSQYLYEINEEDAEKKQEGSGDEDVYVEEKVPDPIAQTVSVDEPVAASSQVEELLKTLEFNQVDMYRNDYPFICSENISKPKQHNFEELFCFVDIEKCAKRYVSSIDWHPQYSGIFVVAYAFRTMNTMKNGLTT